MADSLLVEDVPEDGIVRLTLNRPQFLNALNAELREAMLSRLACHLRDPSIQAIVVTGAEGNFCAGGDLNRLAAMPASEVGALLERGHMLVQMIVESPKPVVAALEGSAAGGGAGLALACDHIVMGESAGIVIPFLKIGLVPDYGIAYTTSRRTGPAVCRRLLLRPSRVAAAEAEILGLADEVRPDGKVQEAAVAAALSLARQPRTAFAWTKRLLSAAMPPIEQLFALEKQAQTACFDSAEFKAAMQRRLAK